jgi:hypothetical protein
MSNGPIGPAAQPVCQASSLTALPDYSCAVYNSRIGPVAQRLEQGTHNPLVVGSNPTGPSHNLRAFSASVC